MKPSELAELGVLCVLNEEARLSRDGVKDRLHHSFGQYWQVNSGVLWPAIDRLEDEGWLDRHVATGADSKRVRYSITGSGVDRLRELLREPVDDIFELHRRHVLIVKLGALHHLPEDEQEAQLERLQRRAEEVLENARIIHREHDICIDDGAEYGYRRELLDLRIRILEELIDWIESIRR